MSPEPNCAGRGPWPASCSILLLALTFIVGCSTGATQDVDPVIGSGPSLEDAPTQYRFGVNPMRSTRLLWSRYQPLVDALNSSVSGFTLRLESGLTDQSYSDKVKSRVLDVLIVQPQAVLATEKLDYAVFARTGARDRISGLIVVRRDSGIKRVRDLAQRTLCFSRPDSLASAMLVRRWLWESSFTFRQARRIMYAGSQESAVLQVYLGNADAAGVSRDAWASFSAQYPHAVPELEVRWRTDDLSGPAVMAHRRVPRQHLRLVAGALTSLAATPRGRTALQTAGISEFRPGESASYDDVWEFLTEYRRLFGEPDQAQRP